MCALCCLIVSYDYSFASLFDIVFLHFSLLLLLLFLLRSFVFRIHLILLFITCIFLSFTLIFFISFSIFSFVIVDVCYFDFSSSVVFVYSLLALSLFCLFHTTTTTTTNFSFSHFYLLSSKYAVCIVFFSRFAVVLFCCAFASLHCHSMKLKIANIKRLCTTKQQQPELGFIRHQISFSVRLSYRFLFTTENGKIREKQKNEPTHSHKPKIVSLKI